MIAYDTNDTTTTTPRLAFRVEGTAGSPVLMVMGLGMRGIAWSPQIGPLSKHHRVVSFDNRGLGNSDRLDQESGRFTMKTLGTDALRLLDHLEIERAHLVGVSLGGMIAQEAALAASDRFFSLTLIATHAGGRTGWLPTPKGLGRFLRVQTSKGERRLAAVEALLYPREFSETTDRTELDERMRRGFGGNPANQVRRRQLRAVMGHDTADRLRTLSTPTLVISPDRDILVRPVSCRRLADLIPGAALKRIPDAGHGLVYQSAEQINEWLLDHFARAERAREGL